MYYFDKRFINSYIIIESKHPALRSLFFVASKAHIFWSNDITIAKSSRHPVLVEAYIWLTWIFGRSREWWGILKKHWVAGLEKKASLDRQKRNRRRIRKISLIGNTSILSGPLPRLLSLLLQPLSMPFSPYLGFPYPFLPSSNLSLILHPDRITSSLSLYFWFISLLL